MPVLNRLKGRLKSRTPQKLRRLAGRLKRRLTGQRQAQPAANGALILMYHRVASAESDPWSLCVSPEHFAEHLAVLKQHRQALHLKDINQRLNHHQPLKGTVAITFDDGYADNLHNAKPLLEQYEIPATAFVTTGGIEKGREFWWDELDRLLLQPGQLPEALELSIAGETFQWTLGQSAQYSQAEFLRDRNWRIEREDQAEPTPRHLLYRVLYEKLQGRSRAERTDILNDLRLWAKAEVSGRLTHRSLTHQEVADFAASDLIEIGAHTVSHPFLANLPIAEQRDEIQQSKDYLENLLNQPVTSFSYPNGSYVAETVSLVKEAGFDYACCSAVSAVNSGTDRFLLPRIVVEDWDGETFSKWLSSLAVA